MGKKSFVITTTVERDLPEFHDYRDEAVQVSVFGAVESRNFHWLELKMRDATMRIEAVRENPDPDKGYRWERPSAFRTVYDKKGQHTEQEIPRGHRGSGLFLLEIDGVKLYEFDHTRVMALKGFVSLSFKVGRLTKTINPQRTEEQSKESKP